VSTDLDAVPTRQHAVTSKPVTLRRTITSEWIKFRTLRSSGFMLAGAVIGTIAIGMIVGWNTRHLNRSLDPEDIVASAVLQGYYLGQLLIGALGVLFVSGEYSTGMIRSTMSAVPRRLPVLVAKVVVFVAVTATTIIPACVIAFVSGQAIISRSRTGFSLGDPGVLRLVVGTGVYLVCIGLIGSACGWIVRNTPGALVTYFAIILVLPGIFGNVLGNWGKDVAQYFPSEAARGFVSSLPVPYTLSTWTGFGVLIAWVVIGLAASAFALRQRDV
jgi:ABC-type transport system involved in multi-copper enzyme maturation permease subunit